VMKGCAFAPLNDPELFSRALDAMVRAGEFTELHRYVHRFEPQGLTATVVLAESHIALHSWPEDGTLFFDIASCSGGHTATRAFESLCTSIPHASVDHEQRGFR
ncbi:MAG: S-adenosylmethionine decarboxylase, partial [Myxococcota bacterium]